MYMQNLNWALGHIKRLVKQSKWQIIDRQAIILCVKVSVFLDSELSICLLFSLPFLVDKSKFRYLNFTSMFCGPILGLPLARFNTALNIYFIPFDKCFRRFRPLLRTTKLCHS
jgi:hypothetical protein